MLGAPRLVYGTLLPPPLFLLSSYVLLLSPPLVLLGLKALPLRAVSVAPPLCSCGSPPPQP
jgi:hypothetical protein